MVYFPNSMQSKIRENSTVSISLTILLKVIDRATKYKQTCSVEPKPKKCCLYGLSATLYHSNPLLLPCLSALHFY